MDIERPPSDNEIDRSSGQGVPHPIDVKDLGVLQITEMCREPVKLIETRTYTLDSKPKLIYIHALKSERYFRKHLCWHEIGEKIWQYNYQRLT